MKQSLGLAVLAACAFLASPAAAMCVTNQTDFSAGVVHGWPAPGMTTYYQALVPAGGSVCVPMPRGANGTTPVSVFAMEPRGKCIAARGCVFETTADQVTFFGTASPARCPTPFTHTACE